LDVVNSLRLLLDHGVIACYCRQITPQQGFPGLAHPLLAAAHRDSRVITTTTPNTMASIFRRIYDWLLRLFWYVCSCAPPLHVLSLAA
jgi:hypothetical protein